LSSNEANVTRRQFLASGALMAGYALAAKPVLAEAIHTSEEGLTTGTARIPVAGGEMEAYFAGPEAAVSPPVVLVVHEIFGVHEYIRDICRRLATEGYFAIAPALYQRQGDVSKYTDASEIIEKVVTRVPDEQVFADLDATLAWVKAEGRGDTQHAAITGFCWGGRIVWMYAAHNRYLAAGVAWYGRLDGAQRDETPSHPIDMANLAHAPVLGLYGTEDSGIPLPTVEKMRGRLAAANRPSQIVLFPGAPHGFHADYRASYRSLAASEGWRRMLEWFREHGAAPPTT